VTVPKGKSIKTLVLTRRYLTKTVKGASVDCLMDRMSGRLGEAFRNTGQTGITPMRD
jgi:hypothetical protein